MGETLVICVGNEGRGDDGVARRVAGLLRDVPGIAVLSATALDVAHAEAVSSAARVVFVDAERRSSPAVRVTPVVAGALSTSQTHGLDAAATLGLALALYGSAPEAYLVSLAAPDMGHGDAVSPAAETAIEECVSTVRDLVTE